MFVQCAAKGGLASTTGAAESGCAHEYSLSIDFDEEMNKLDTENATLRRGSAATDA